MSLPSICPLRGNIDVHKAFSKLETMIIIQIFFYASTTTGFNITFLENIE
jgi:hypothetical protein